MKFVMPFRFRLILHAGGLVLFLFAGCGTARENATKSSEVLGRHIAAEASFQGRREKRSIAWSAALELMCEHNLELRQSRAAIVSSEAAIERVWLDMVPGLTLGYSIDRSLTALASGAEGSLSVYGFLNLAGLISTRMRHYTASLALVRAEYAYALKEREQTAALWMVFRAAKRLEEKKAWAKFVQRRNLESAFNSRLDAAMGEFISDYALKREESDLRDRFAKLLGDYRTEYIPDDTGLPELNYSKVKVDLGDTKEWGLLLNKYTATELEGARLRLLGAKLAYWPDIQISVQSPPLYTSDGAGYSWSADALRLSTASIFRPDTTLSTSYSLMETKRQMALLRAFIRQSTAERLSKLRNQEEYSEVMTAREAELKRRMMRMLSASQATGYAEFAIWSDAFKNILTERIHLEEERDALNSVYWLIHEPKWRVPMLDRWKRLDKQKIERDLQRLDQDAEKEIDKKSVSK